MEKSPSINYVDPKKDLEEEGLGQHRFDLTIDGEKIGGVEINYFSKPLPLYQVTDLYVDFKYKGNHYASRILDQVEEWIVNRKKPGVLVDATLHEENHGMYAKRGWVEIPGSQGLHVYNWPKEVSLDIMKGYANRYTDYLERDK